MIAITPKQDAQEMVEVIATTINKPDRYIIDRKNKQLVLLRSFASDTNPFSMCRVVIKLGTWDEDSGEINEVEDADISTDPKKIRDWMVTSKVMPKQTLTLADLIDHE